MSKRSGLHIYQDSGDLSGSTDYTTLILLHGYAWHSGIFSKLVPLSKAYNTRIVLVNRRDYPGAAPYSAEQRALLDAAAAVVESDPGAARAKILSFMQSNARDLYDLILEFVAENTIPKASGNSGGIVVGGWSFAADWMAALLAYADSFPMEDIDLGLYVRRVILYDAPYYTLGYPPLNGDISGNPLFDAWRAPDERTRMFADWVSGYFKQADSLDALERYTPLAHPPSTISTMTTEELASALYPAPGDPGGSDCVLLSAGVPSGAFRVLRESALRLPQHAEGVQLVGRASSALAMAEVLYVWCDATVWDIVYGVHAMKQDVEAERKAGRRLRKVTFARVRGANHFVHWDYPQDALRACLATPGPDLEEVVVGAGRELNHKVA